MKQNTSYGPIKASTQDFTEIEIVADDIVALKDRSACTIIAVGTTNFVLLSSEEQLAMMTSYASLLNSLSFPVQIVILSKKMNIASYVAYIERKIQQQPDAHLAKKLAEYKTFIATVVGKNTILEKKFYCTIPFSPLEMGVTGTRNKTLNPSYVITRAKTSLYPKRDHLLRLLRRVGIPGKVLYEQEIIELFYNLYNPVPEERKIDEGVTSYYPVAAVEKK